MECPLLHIPTEIPSRLMNSQPLIIPLQTFPDGHIIYHYVAEDPLCYVCVYPNGVEVLHFKNGESEKHFPDGTKEYILYDRVIREYPHGQREEVLTNMTMPT